MAKKTLATERLAYSREEVADMVGMSVSSIRRAIAAGDLHAKRTTGRILITRDALAEWLESLADA